MISIESFIDEVKPLDTIAIAGKEYPVYAPEELPEKNYIKYFSARAKTLDIVHKYGEVQTLPNGAKRFVPSTNPASVLLSEVEMVTPAKEMVSALLQIDREDQTFNKFALYPKNIIRLYNEIERLLQKVETPSEQEDKAEDPLETTTPE